MGGDDSAAAGLRRRAAVHAALADPTRLHAVDLLALGDLAPGELAAALGVPGNLLAHHLKVLEGAGIVARRRSEGDRRRTYVTLLDASLAVPTARSAPRVVFVCTHSSARSHLAAVAFTRASRLAAASAGTEPAPEVHPGAVAAAARHGLDLTGRTPAHVDDVVRADDLVVAVCDGAYETSLAAARPVDLHWSVPDPVRVGTDDAFEDALLDITARVDRLGRALADPPT
ncbi:arsenate reductase/protein-tyrosine-phosphatase family protein [Aquipuribacter sp. SD81]|uniref:arsenate reductase/protein-tyrosine-phosphatase family protein n=1 Tax=Aquipuribacter sp. SD81 TaxID=3127703 RepID=UPI003019DA86